MLELWGKLMSHLQEAAFEFAWWEIYSYWFLVVAIFVVDRTLCLRRVRKEQAATNAYSQLQVQLRKETEQELKRAKEDLHEFSLRHGARNSLNDCSKYKMKINEVSFTEMEPLSIKFPKKPIVDNLPKLGNASTDKKENLNDAGQDC